MNRQELSVQIIDAEGSLTIREVLACLRLDREQLEAMVEAGLLEPIGPAEAWRFASRDLRRLRAAQRLISDLDVNLAGAAVILDLIDERDRLLARLAALERTLDDS